MIWRILSHKYNLLNFIHKNFYPYFSRRILTYFLDCDKNDSSESDDIHVQRNYMVNKLVIQID